MLLLVARLDHSTLNQQLMRTGGNRVNREAESWAGLNSHVALALGVRLVRHFILIQFLVSPFPLLPPVEGNVLSPVTVEKSWKGYTRFSIPEHGE
jgi:hypothetical protein